MSESPAAPPVAKPEEESHPSEPQVQQPGSTAVPVSFPVQSSALISVGAYGLDDPNRLFGYGSYPQYGGFGGFSYGNAGGFAYQPPQTNYMGVGGGLASPSYVHPSMYTPRSYSGLNNATICQPSTYGATPAAGFGGYNGYYSGYGTSISGYGISAPSYGAGPTPQVASAVTPATRYIPTPYGPRAPRVAPYAANVSPYGGYPSFGYGGYGTPAAYGYGESLYGLPCSPTYESGRFPAAHSYANTPYPVIQRGGSRISYPGWNSRFYSKSNAMR